MTISLKTALRTLFVVAAVALISLSYSSTSQASCHGGDSYDSYSVCDEYDEPVYEVYDEPAYEEAYYEPAYEEAAYEEAYD